MVAVQSLSRVWLFATPWTTARQASLSFTISRSLLKLMSVESVMPSNHLLLPSIFPSIRIFSNESALLIRWPKYCSFSINPFNEYSGLIPFRIDWFYLLVSLLADISACLRGFLVMWFINPFSKIPKALTTRIFSRHDYYPCLFSMKTEHNQRTHCQMKWVSPAHELHWYSAQCLAPGKMPSFHHPQWRCEGGKGAYCSDEIV